MHFDKMLDPMNILIKNDPYNHNRADSRSYDPEQLESVNNLLKGAQGDVTFWGTRCIKKAGFTGTSSLDVLVQRVSVTSVGALIHGYWSLERRIAGLNIIERVKQLLQQSDRQIQQANVVTRLLVWVRNKFGHSHTRISRYIVDGVASQDLRTFIPRNFLETFQGKFDENGSHSCCEQRLKSWDRIVATQKSIVETFEIFRKIPPEVIGLILSKVDGSLTNTSEACKKFNASANAQLAFECKALVREIIANAKTLQLVLNQQKASQQSFQSAEGSVALVSSPSFTDFEVQIPSRFKTMSFQEAKNTIRVVFLKLALRMKVLGYDALKLFLQPDHQSSYLSKSLCFLWNDTLQNVVGRRLEFLGEGAGVCVGLLSQGDLTTARTNDIFSKVPEILGAYRTYLLAHDQEEAACVVRNKHQYLSEDVAFFQQISIGALCAQEACELIHCFFMRGDFTEQKFITARKAIDQMDENAGRSEALLFLVENLLVNKKWKEALQTCGALKDESLRTTLMNKMQCLLLFENKPQEAAEIIKLYSDKNIQLREISFVINGYLILGKIQEAIKFATFFSEHPEITSTISKLLFDQGFGSQAQDLVSKMTDSDVKKEAHAYTSKEGSDPVPIDQDDVLQRIESVFTGFKPIFDNSFSQQCSSVILNAFFGERAKAISLVKELPNKDFASDKFFRMFSSVLARAGEIEDALQINKMISDASVRLDNVLEIVNMCPGCLKKAGGMQKIVGELSRGIRPSPQLLEVFFTHAVHFGYAAEVVKIIQNLQYTEELGDSVIPALLVHRPDLVTPELCVKLVRKLGTLSQIVSSLLLLGNINKAMQIAEHCILFFGYSEDCKLGLYLTVIDFLLTTHDLKKAIELAEKSPPWIRRDLEKRFHIKFGPDKPVSRRLFDITDKFQDNFLELFSHLDHKYPFARRYAGGASAINLMFNPEREVDISSLLQRDKLYREYIAVFK
jgi:hypothetical protein